VLELVIALFLIALNGLFSLWELAVVSARKARCGPWPTRAGRVRPRHLSSRRIPALSLNSSDWHYVGRHPRGRGFGAALGARLTDTLTGLGIVPWLA
jgi:putative hemolysin